MVATPPCSVKSLDVQCREPILFETAMLAITLSRAPKVSKHLGVFGIAVGRPGEVRPVTLLIDEAPSLG